MYFTSLSLISHPISSSLTPYKYWLAAYHLYKYSCLKTYHLFNIKFKLVMINNSANINNNKINSPRFLCRLTDFMELLRLQQLH